MIGIIGAMDSEVESLFTQMSAKEKININNLTFYKGQLFGKDVVIVKCGTGIAGATGPGLKIYDFVVSTEALYHDFDTTFFGYKPGQVPGMPEAFTADSALVDAAMTAFEQTDFHDLKIVKGRIASGDQFISGGERKAFIINTFKPQCVEMEGCAIAQACYANKVPFVIIRCMSDAADDSVKETYSEETAAKLSSNFLLEVIKQI